MLPPTKTQKTDFMNNIIKESKENGDSTDVNPPSSTEDFCENSKKLKKSEDLPQKSKKTTKKPTKKSKKLAWPIVAFLLTIVLSFTIGLVSQSVMANITTKTVIFAYLLILLIIIISIVTDIIAVATTSCDVQPFLSMSAKKIKGAKMAVKLCKNAGVVSSVCGDIIGDICSVVSGAGGAAIVAVMALTNNTTQLIVSVVCSAIISTIMVTGKACGKNIAIKNANSIVFAVAKVLSIFSKK